MYILNKKIQYITNRVGFSSINPATASPTSTFYIGTNVNEINTINEIRILTNLKAGTSIKIYRND